MKRLKEKYGFTAIEIAMVATVIAILALLILPLFRKRTAEAKIVAARDELQSLAKSLAIANFDTNKWFRLQDLDNTTNFNDPPLNADLEVPVCVWNRTLATSERDALKQPDQWQGPYHSVPKFITLGELRASTGRPYMLSTNGGPIYYDAAVDKDEDKIPVDPWGSPYILFAPGQISEYPGYTGAGGETTYGNGVIYSLGPNAVPGDDVIGATDADNYQRWGDVIGTGDEGELSLIFYF